MSLSQDGAKSVLAELERMAKEGGMVKSCDWCGFVHSLAQPCPREEEPAKEMPKLVPPAEEPRKPYREEE